MVTKQRYVVTVCKPGTCRVCDGREAASFGLRTSKATPQQTENFHKTAMDSNLTRMQGLLHNGGDVEKAIQHLHRAFAFGKLLAVPEMQESYYA